MPVHIIDSALYRNSWGTPELRALFDEVSVVTGWVSVRVLPSSRGADAMSGTAPARARKAPRQCHRLPVYSSRTPPAVKRWGPGSERAEPDGPGLRRTQVQISDPGSRDEDTSALDVRDLEE